MSAVRQNLFWKLTCEDIQALLKPPLGDGASKDRTGKEQCLSVGQKVVSKYIVLEYICQVRGLDCEAFQGDLGQRVAVQKPLEPINNTL
jgi:hypothetical protein